MRVPLKVEDAGDTVRVGATVGVWERVAVGGDGVCVDV